MNKVFLSLGGNIGNVKGNMKEARKMITENCGKIIQQSSLYKTEAWGKQEQPDFLNQVIEIETELSPEKLLKEILQIEKLLCRKRIEKWEPRTMDIDILFYEDKIIESRILTIPHTYIHKRKFVLIPLHEIAPDLIHPVLQLTIREILNTCNDVLRVEKVVENKN